MVCSRLPLPRLLTQIAITAFGCANDMQAQRFTRQTGKGAVTVRRYSCVGVPRASTGWNGRSRGCWRNSVRWQRWARGRDRQRGGQPRYISSDRVPGRGFGGAMHLLRLLLHRAIVAPYVPYKQMRLRAVCLSVCLYVCLSALACASPSTRLRAFNRAVPLS